MLWKNFLRNYGSNRAPLYLNLHSPWLNTQYQLEAMDEFIQKMVSMEDVYLVTVTQALQWQMNPTPLDQLRDFKHWQCPNFRPNAEDAKVCKFTYKHRTAPGGGNATQSLDESVTLSPGQSANDSKPTESSITVRQEQTTAKDVKPSQKKTPRRFGGADNAHDNHHDHDHEKENTHSSHNSEYDHGNSIHHHHNHRTHKPWFLRGDASTTTPYIHFLCVMFAAFALFHT